MKDSVQNPFKSIRWLPQYRHASPVIQESNHKCSTGEHINNSSNIQKKGKENWRMGIFCSEALTVF